jgi:ABC-type hemin transport system ATPase subunit
VIPERAVSQLPLSQIGGEEVVDKFLFLDEAVSHLDLKHQRQLLQITKKFCDNRFTAIVILHDINLSLTYADRNFVYKRGTDRLRTKTSESNYARYS